MNKTFKALKDMEAFNHEVQIFVPSTQGVNSGASKAFVEEVVYKTQVALAQLFGGYTTFKANGGWFDTSNSNWGLVEEGVTVVTANFPENKLTDENITKAVAIAQAVKDDMEQDCVSFKLDGVLYFI